MGRTALAVEGTGLDCIRPVKLKTFQFDSIPPLGLLFTSATGLYFRVVTPLQRGSLPAILDLD